MWERYYGEIPKNCLIIHKDGNKENNDINNLEMITREENAVMCQKGLGISKNKNITETNILLVRLMRKTYRIKKDSKI